MWDELIVPLLQAEHEETPLTTEQEIFKPLFFADPSMRSCVARCRDQYDVRRKASEAQQALLEHARVMFRPEFWSSVWQPLCLQKKVRWQQYEYDRLFDPREENDKKGTHSCVLYVVVAISASYLQCSCKAA